VRARGEARGEGAPPSLLTAPSRGRDARELAAASQGDASAATLQEVFDVPASDL
jgi:hypothetical protein